MAEEKKAYIVDLNNTRALDEYGNLVRPHLMGGSSKAILAYVVKNGGLVKVYNQAEYVFKAETEMEADPAATTLDPVTASRKYDYNTSTKAYDILSDENVPYEGVLELEANTSGEVKTGEFTVTQPKSGLSITCTYTQAADEWTGTYAYSNFLFKGASFEDMSAGGGLSYFMVTVSVYRQEIWHSGMKNGKTVTSTLFYDVDGILNDSAGLGCTLSLSASAVSGTNSSVNSATGVVTGYDWYHTEFEGGSIATATNIIVGFKGMTDGSFSTYRCYQDANVRSKSGDPVYSVAISAEDYVAASVTSVEVLLEYAFKTQYYSWSSGAPNTSDSTGITASLTTTGDSIVPRTLTNRQTAILTIPANTSETQTKTYTVTAYAGSASDTISITQYAAEPEEYWASPALNGEIVIEKIPADGSAVSILVPIIQYKYKGGVIVDTYSTSVMATAISGTAESGTGAYFSGGEISCDSMGTTSYPSGRLVYTLKKVTVTGKDGRSYEITLTSYVKIYQDKNELTTIYGSYILSISASPSSGIANTGGTAAITASARRNVSYSWSSGAPVDDDVIDVTATLSTNYGSISPTSITGSGSATLTLGENISSARTAVVNVSVGGESESCYVQQNAVSYTFTAGEDKECNATASTVYVSFESSRNGSPWQPTFSSSLSGVSIGSPSLSGTTYTVAVSVPENTSTENRDIVITATQPRYNMDATRSVTITQAAKQVDSRTAMLVGGDAAYASSDKSSIAATLLFDARDTDKYKGGTVSSVSAWISTSEGSGGSTVGSVQNIGDISVSEGSYTTRTLTWSKTSGYSALYLHVRYDSTKEYVVQVEEYIPEG